MRKAALYAVCLALVLCRPNWAQRSAGMVLYHQSGGETYLLLADHRTGSRGWAAYGGGAHGGETPAETAARETEEETRGFFQRAHLLELVGSQTPVIDDNGFALFFVEVDFAPAPSVANNKPPPDNQNLERETYAWIPYSAIEGHLTADIDHKREYPIDRRYLPTGSRTHWLWTVWLGNMRKAAQSNAIPWVH